MTANDTKYGPTIAHRRKKARERCLQALYQWDLNNESASVIIRQFLDSQDMRNTDIDYFQSLLSSTIKNIAALDQQLKPLCQIEFIQLDPVERSILRLAVNELSNHLETPYRVIVNEGIELAKRYGGEQSHKFVNGVLDKAAQTLRSAEIKSKPR